MKGAKMRRKLIPILLALTLVVPTIIIPVNAANTYGKVPILTGYANVDYQADQILSEIPTAGKNTHDQIQAVYDWIIRHCQRNDWDGTYYYDEKAVEAAATVYESNMEQRIYQGKAVIRQEMEPYWGLADNSYDYFSFDSNSTIAYKAMEMMLKRTGDCVNYSSLFAVLLGHLGYDCHVIPGNFINPNGSKVSHKWNYVLIDGKYYWFDIRIDHSFYVRRGSKSIPHDYFMISDTKKWEASHEWDHTYSNMLASNASTVTSLYNRAIQDALGAESYEEVNTTGGSLSRYWKMNEYVPGQFKDVKAGAWYEENVKDSFEYGLLLGTGDGRFGVGENLTIAQTLAIADRLHNRYYGGSSQFLQRDPWYQVYIDYAERYRIISQGQYDPLATATRAQFAQILSDALPDEALESINQITSIPDVYTSAPYADAVYRLYNAGILTGNDASGTFEPNTPIKREQVAAMATRFANPQLRKMFTLN